MALARLHAAHAVRGAASDSVARPPTHARYARAAGRRPPEGDQRAPRSRDGEHHARHLLPRDPRHAGRGRGEDRRRRIRSVAMEKITVILGAGASYDVHNGTVPLGDRNWKPPLARELFEARFW